MSKPTQTVVKLKKGGDLFEVICKPETVIPYRNGKLPLDKVLLAEEIFTNFSKLTKVKSSELKKAFNTEDRMECIKTILQEGECPLTKKEMEAETTKKRAEIMKYLTTYYFNPTTQPATPHPQTRFEQAFETLKISVHHNKTVEEQIKEIAKKLPESIPIKPMDPPHIVRMAQIEQDRKDASKNNRKK